MGGDAHGALNFWDPYAQTLLHTTPRGHSQAVTDIEVSEDGTLLATLGHDQAIRLWSIASSYPLKRVKDFVADDNLVWSVRFSPDSKYLATASSDEVVAVWDIGSAQRMATFAGRTGGATDVAYLSEGATIVAVDRTGRLHWRDVCTGRHLAEAWRAHDSVIWRIAIHPDREQLATAGADGRGKDLGRAGCGTGLRDR